MANRSVLPSLSGAGWVTEPGKMLSLLYAQALIALRSQSTIYYGNITSIPQIIASYQNSPSLLIEEMEKSLSNYLASYFDAVVVNVTSDATDLNLIIGYTIYIYIKVTRDGIEKTLSVAMNTDDVVLRKVLGAINE